MIVLFEEQLHMGDNLNKQLVDPMKTIFQHSNMIQIKRSRKWMKSTEFPCSNLIDHKHGRQ